MQNQTDQSAPATAGKASPASGASRIVEPESGAAAAAADEVPAPPACESGAGGTEEPESAFAFDPSKHCARCRRGLGDDAVITDFEMYHLKCFRCSSCNGDLKKTYNYVWHEQKVFCRRCSDVMFHPPCAECGISIALQQRRGQPVAALGRLFHAKCFCCATCEKRITAKFFVPDRNQVYCPRHPPDGATDEMKRQLGSKKSQSATNSSDTSESDTDEHED